MAHSDPMDCKNGCGFFGSQDTAGLCSKCYRDMVLQAAANATASTATPAAPAVVQTDLTSKKSRCGREGCKKRVGLTAVECRCGNVHCAEHRYSDMHSCTFDYKAAAREAIAKANPRVARDKLQKL